MSAASIRPDEALQIEAELENVGDRAGDEVVQLYVRDLEASVPVPIHQLQGFKRVHLRPGERTTVRFELTARQLSLIDGAGRRVVEPGMFEVSVGGCQPVAQDPARSDTSLLIGRFRVKGTVYPIDPF